ncbi:MAG: threonylcarbamoyl-AMP synthase [Deltaproteobacteria bacterium]|nr:MAG: threonylcarbamoyl-AMP synthase [Deltaproteobacteria bacterium]
MMGLKQAIDALRRGEVVALPTETVYGLGGVATKDAAVERIFAAKGRPRDNPLICHFFDAEHILPFVKDVPPYWDALLQAFSPGPVSYRLPLPQESTLRPAVAGQSTVVCRIPNQPLCLEVIRQLQQPIAAPSANTSGRVSPTTAEMVEVDLGHRIAGVLDGGPCLYGLESTILDCCESSRITILRPGAVGPDEIVAALKQAGFSNVSVSYAEGTQQAVVPGSKYRHYAPEQTLLRVPSVHDVPDDVSCAVLVSQESWAARAWPDSVVPVILGSRSDLPAVARELYQHIKSLDEHHVDAAYYVEEEWGDSSLGRAIANRLNRASEL